ncbi:MAG TPA: hypothetical protein VJZ98_07405 [Actinomycetota bacterium]|nr:hypothetical protein [Actinomycetota bacterium]
MEDFNALAMSLAQDMADVRGCLILSRDGLVLGAHPAESERTTTRAWIRFATIGDPERGFAQFGSETWCYVRRAPYAGFAVAGPGARPGLVIDHMEQVLLEAEESRSRQEGPRGTEDATVAPRSRPRSYLNPEPPGPDPLVIDIPAPVVAGSSSGDPPDPPPPFPGPEPETTDEPPGDDAETAERAADPFAELVGEANEPVADQPWEPTSPVPLPDPLRWPHRGPEPDAEPRLEPVDEADEASGAGPETGPGAGFEPEHRAAEEDDDVDRFSLAREFGRLLQRGEDPADG